MSTQILAPPRTEADRGPLLPMLGYIAVGLGAMLILFGEDVAAAVEVWSGSTAYNHCFLIAPVAAYLIWDRRDRIAGLRPRPSLGLGLLALPVSIAWLGAERLGIMEFRQLLAVTEFEIILIAVLGWRFWYDLCGPFLYLYFLVPFGSFLTPALQSITAWFVMHGLDLLGIPNYTDGLTIQIPEGTFVIAQACAGLRFLIASIAFGCLYALLLYRSTARRTVFMAASVVVPVVANGLRALGIVVLGHVLGSAQAAETDHVLYGWIFFSIVIVALILLGLPFRQDCAPDPVRQPVGPDRRWVLAAPVLVLVLACAAVGPAFAHVLSWSAERPDTPVLLRASGSCRPLSENRAVIDPDIPGRITSRRFACVGADVTVLAVSFPARTAPRPIVRARERLTGAEREDAEAAQITDLAAPWQIQLADTPPEAAASLVLSDGRPTRPGLSFRVRQAWRSIAGGGSVVLLIVTADPVPAAVAPDGRRYSLSALSDFLKAEPDPAALLATADIH